MVHKINFNAPSPAQFGRVWCNNAPTPAIGLTLSRASNNSAHPLIGQAFKRAPARLGALAQLQLNLEKVGTQMQSKLLVYLHYGWDQRRRASTEKRSQSGEYKQLFCTFELYNYL